MTFAALGAPPLAPGTLVGAGRFALEEEIGRGGYGITYRARRVETGEAVAVKECVLSSCTRESTLVAPCDDAAADALAVWGERVVAQTLQLESLEHPHLARVFEAWAENNTVYLAMELLEGPTLAEHIGEHGPLSVDEALLHARAVADALGALHQRGLAHLDVKPENIVLSERGAVLLDFDLVQPCGVEQVSTRPLSLAGRIGTPGYAPPEAYGEVAPQGARSDIYSLGATLYFLLSGCIPPAAVDRAAGIELPALSVAPHLGEALVAALQLPIEARPATVAELRELWVAPPPPPAPEEDYSFSAHAANLAQSKSSTGICRVVLTTSNPKFPPRCACCFERADDGVSLILPSASGRQYIPGCAACLRHQHVARASANGTGWGLILSSVLALAGAWLSILIDSPVLMVLCISALVICFGTMAYGALKSSRAEEMLKSTCCHSVEPVAYNFNGRAHIWRFKNMMYAEEFKKKNAEWVV